MEKILEKLKIIEADFCYFENVKCAIQSISPELIFNLGGQSSVGQSHEDSFNTMHSNVLPVLNILEYIKLYQADMKFYQASSSEMFGNSVDDDGFQRMNTPMHPVSPYGCAKLLAYNLTRHYRNAYKLHICNGILFNHESPRRGSNFVTNKIIKTAVEIKKGKRLTKSQMSDGATYFISSSEFNNGFILRSSSFIEFILLSTLGTIVA